MRVTLGKPQLEATRLFRTCSRGCPTTFYHPLFPAHCVECLGTPILRDGGNTRTNLYTVDLSDSAGRVYNASPPRQGNNRACFIRQFTATGRRLFAECVLGYVMGDGVCTEVGERSNGFKSVVVSGFRSSQLDGNWFKAVCNRTTRS